MKQNNKRNLSAASLAVILLLAVITFFAKKEDSGDTGALIQNESFVETQLVQQEEHSGTKQDLEQGDIEQSSRLQQQDAETEQEILEEDSSTESTQLEKTQQQNTEIKNAAEEILTYQFRKEQYLTQHFQKHGAEFPYDTEEEYLQGANKVINNPASLHKIEAEDGDDVYYLEETNEFVIVSTDGYIRTYFKPNSGIDYYNRQ